MTPIERAQLELLRAAVTRQGQVIAELERRVGTLESSEARRVAILEAYGAAVAEMQRAGDELARAAIGGRDEHQPA